MPTVKSLPRPKITLRELDATEVPAIFSLISTLNPKLTKAEFTARLMQMLPLGYRVVGAFEGKTLLGISGFWIGMRFWCGARMDIDNFVVHPKHRNRNIGQKLIVWLEKKAVALKLDLIVLDTYASSALAHRFYFRNGFVITGYHMTKIPGVSTPYGQCG